MLGRIDLTELSPQLSLFHVDKIAFQLHTTVEIVTKTTNFAFVVLLCEMNKLKMGFNFNLVERR
jgi:hypothetical protein